MIIRYVKAPVSLNSEKENRNPKISREKFLAKSLLVIGILIIGSTAWPIISYELFTAPLLKPTDFLIPVPVLGREQVESNETQTPRPNIAGLDTTDLTRPQNWFPKADYETKRSSKITHYSISIPRFGIENAVVEIGGNDLSKALIHYPETALPGQLGATVVFGHSILPQFFNPKDYMSIFSLIPTLELGDEVKVRFDGVTYTYRVMDKVEVKPTNLSVLDQPYDNEYLRLITCTPPGTYLKRGVITAALVD